MPDIFLTDKDKNELEAKIETKEPRISYPVKVTDGGTGAKTVEEALANLGILKLVEEIKALINGRTLIETGSYTGTGQTSNKRLGYVQINFSAAPLMVIVHTQEESDQSSSHNSRCDSAIGIFIKGAPYGTIIGNYGTGTDTGDNKAKFSQVPLTWGDTFVKWTTSSDAAKCMEQLDANIEYRYAGILM